MVEKFPWIERKFKFDLPTWMYPNLVERVRGTPARVEDIVTGLTSGVLTQRDRDTWSIQENVGHLLDLESLWFGRLNELMKGMKELRAWEQTNSDTWNANHNSKLLKDICSGFREARFEFVRQLDSLDDAMIERTALHPRLQTPMRTIDLVSFVAEHDDYHLARISVLKRLFGGANAA
jgi:uncharacterized damage-inducible protein DinB